MFVQPYDAPRISTLAELEQKGVEFFRFLGIETLAEARALPAVLLRNKMEEFGVFWSVVADGKFQKQISWDTAKRGALPDIPLLIGDTNAEFFAVPQAETDEDLRALAERHFGTDADRFLSLIGAQEGLEQAKQRATVSAVEIAIRALANRREEKRCKEPVLRLRVRTGNSGLGQPRRVPLKRSVVLL